MEDKDRAHTVCGTYNYMAPEIFENNGKGYSFEVDIWSVGIIMYQLLTAKLIFNGENKDEFQKKILYGFVAKVKSKLDFRIKSISKEVENLQEIGLDVRMVLSYSVVQRLHLMYGQMTQMETTLRLKMQKE